MRRKRLNGKKWRLMAYLSIWRQNGLPRRKLAVFHKHMPDYIWKSLESDVFSALGQMPVTELKAHILIVALETLRCLTQRINEILKFSINSCLLDTNSASTIGEVFEKPKKLHMATIRPESLPELVQHIETANLALMSRYLIKWQLLTLVRPGEASGAR